MFTLCHFETKMESIFLFWAELFVFVTEWPN